MLILIFSFLFPLLVISKLLVFIVFTTIGTPSMLSLITIFDSTVTVFVIPPPPPPDGEEVETGVSVGALTTNVLDD